MDTDWTNHTAGLQSVQKNLWPLSGIEFSFLPRLASSLVTIRTKLSGGTRLVGAKSNKTHSRTKFPYVRDQQQGNYSTFNPEYTIAEKHFYRLVAYLTTLSVNPNI
jgi:hypothetical protein